MVAGNRRQPDRVIAPQDQEAGLMVATDRLYTPPKLLAPD